MADAEVEATESEGEGAKKKLPIKMVIVVLGLLVAEAGVVIGAVSMLSKPDAVQAQSFVEEEPSPDEDSVEVPIVSDKFPNHDTGRVWLWEIEALVKVKQKNLEYVQKIEDEHSAEIKTGIGKIIRTANHDTLKEPSLETLTRLIEQYLNNVFGEDSEGERRVQGVLLPKCVGFPADF